MRSKIKLHTKCISTIFENQNQMVGLLLPDISNPFFPRLVRGAESYLKDKGYRIMVGTISDQESFE